METILRRPAVLTLTGDKHTKHFDDIRSGLFIRPVKTGIRAVGWPASEVQAINQARIAGKSQEQIRDLVRSLEAARKVSA